MRPVKPRGPAGGGMPVGPAVNVLPTRGGPMPGPAVNVLPTRGGDPVIGGGGPANPMPMPRPTSMPMTNVLPVRGMKKGGSASSRADGCAVRGKTKGKIV